MQQWISLPIQHLLTQSCTDFLNSKKNFGLEFRQQLWERLETNNSFVKTLQCKYPTSQWRENHSILIVQIHVLVLMYFMGILPKLEGLDTELLNFVAVYLLSTLRKTPCICLLNQYFLIAVCNYRTTAFPPLLFYRIPFGSPIGAYHE